MKTSYYVCNHSCRWFIEWFVFILVKGLSHLVFAEGVNETCIDVVDGEAENHNNNVLGHSFGEGVSGPEDHGHVGGWRVHLLMSEKKRWIFITYK